MPIGCGYASAVTESVGIAILGAGNIEISPPVVASLASYFGERPLELRLYDGDEERLDLLDRMARACFILNKTPHSVFSSLDVNEVLHETDRVILQVDAHGAKRSLKGKQGLSAMSEAEMICASLAKLMEHAPENVETLSLQGPDVTIPLGLYRRLDWPVVKGDEVQWMPHQILRWIRGEEPIYEILAEHDKSPLKAWLDDPNSAELVINSEFGIR